MTEKRYHTVQSWFRARPAALRVLKAAGKLLPALIYLSYFAMLGLLFLQRDSRLWRATLVPAAVFAGGTLLRSLIDAPRPYEVYRTPPLTPKDRQGCSFPSRHLFSASVISMCGLWLWLPLGVLLWAVTLLLAPIRVLCGVHFVKDVAAGIGLGVLFGWLGFFLF